MRTLYLFNPENDMALASGSPYYMAPGSAKKMAIDLSALPAWYAEKGGDVLLANVGQVEWMANECPFSLGVNLVHSIPSVCDEVIPWGWSPMFLRRLKQEGVSDAILPSGEQVEQIRSLSSRCTAVKLLPGLRFSGTVGESEWLMSVEEVSAFVEKHGKILLKAPWSGSGKGIRPLKNIPGKDMCGWINRIVSVQGGVVGEPFYNKCIDFAMEFRVDDNNLSFVGYSMFETDPRGIYKGNSLRSDEDIEMYLSSLVTVDLLRKIREHLLQELAALFVGVYKGCLGVDMMVCLMGEGEYVVHPCVEINLRMNMGLVSRIFYDRYVHPDAVGNYVVEFYSNSGEALRFHEQMKSKYPLELVDGRLFRGYLSLTPIFEDTQYQVFVFV